MRDLNDRIRSGIANSYRLRSLAKDSKLTQQQHDKVYELAKENDKKILFYKNIDKALKK